MRVQRLQARRLGLAPDQDDRPGNPARASRRWLVLAVATLAVVRAGGAAESGLEALSWDGLPDLAPVRPRRTRPRLLSCFRHGLIRVLVAVVRGRRLPRGRFLPDPWPLQTHTHLPTLTVGAA